MPLIHGFELLRDETIAELQTRARIYRHVQSGAELMSLENEDENKVFGVTFRTPPTDSTGLPHIMEHAVLAGSRKYPLKEPFVQLIKGSLKTYLNASTYPDKTVYPVASTNLQDFYNLVDVYLDAVFHPLITPHHLEQEGWHYELESVDATPTYKGVVFNEMKGAYSSPDNMLYRYAKQALFPDNAYSHDSGGDPSAIPDLTYAQFQQFHATYYHPSNARIFFYGDDDPTERLRLLDEALREFQAINVDGEIALQQPFGAPRRATHTYGVDADSDLHKKTHIQLSWLLPENDDATLDMGLSLLSFSLLGTPASPLRKILTESGLGEDLTGGGLSTSLRQMTFSVGLKGVADADVDQVETLILTTLQNLAAQGIESETVEAALNTIEFSLRENNTGSYPRGLSLMLRSLSTWLYNRDPLMPLGYEAPLAAIKAQLGGDPHYLQALIKRYLLDNSHRSTVILRPDPEHNQRLEAAEKARLAAIGATLAEHQRAEIIAQVAELKQRQEALDPPELLAALPMLKLSDLEREIKTLPLDVQPVTQAGYNSEILYHDLFTNGIVYFTVGFNLRVLPAALLPYIHLFGRALVEMGTTHEDYVKLQQRIGRKTGGVWHSVLLATAEEYNVVSSDETLAKFLLSGKATVAQLPELLAILRDVLCEVKLDDRERFRQIVLKAKARNESGIVPSGHSVVNGRLRASFNTAYWIDEEMGGVNYLFFLRRLAERIENDWASVLTDLETVRRLLVNRNGLMVNVTLDSDNWRTAQPQVIDFMASLPAAPSEVPSWTPVFDHANEGLIVPAQVNYVGKGANLYDLGYHYHGSVAVISNFVRTGWLWDKIRMQGGAYGAFCRFSKRSGVLTFLSYRDPNLQNTLAVYDQTAAVLRATELNETELTRNIIGAVGAMDGYQLPDAKGYTSMVRYLMGESDAERQQVRDEVLGTTLADFHAFADVLDAAKEVGRIVIMGSQQALTTANNDAPGWLNLLKVM